MTTKTLRTVLRSFAALAVIGGLLFGGWWFARDTQWYADLTADDEQAAELPSDLTEVFDTAVVTRGDVADLGELDARLVYQDEVLFTHRVDPIEVTTTTTIGFGRAAQTVSTTTEEPDSRAVTDLPEPGAQIAPGDVLYETDSSPVYAVGGSIAAWRTMDDTTDGADVAQLQQYLLDGGWADTDLEPHGEWTAATTDAVEAWQDATEQTVTGVVELGDIWFIPSSIRIVETLVTVGMVVSDGDQVLRYTSEERNITVSVAELPEGLLNADDITAQLPDRSVVDAELASTRGTDTGFDLVFTVDLAGQNVGSLNRLPVTLEWTVAELVDELTIPPEAIQRLDTGVYVVSVLDGDVIRRTEVEVIGQAGRVVAITGLAERARVIIP
jgi:hypothetical protein